VLAVQGGFAAHAAVLARLGHEVVEVRESADLDRLEGLVLPGGESTTQLDLLGRNGLFDAVGAFLGTDRPVLATCAGLILAAKQVEPEQRSFGLLDVTVSRNAWGAQVHSFEATTDRGDLPLVFIRAPRITRVGTDVEVVATFEGEPVMVRQGQMTAATFHPELADDPAVHRMVFGGQ
jgi:5'-phosphate synthase pdxT subunit